MTKGFDIVLLVEALDDDFLALFWKFVREGGYQIKECSDGTRNLFRFLKPTDKSFPAMLESGTTRRAGGLRKAPRRGLRR